MNDQASALRARTAREEAPADPREARAIVVGGGKGGAGVSVLSVLLASAIARTGARVLLMDAAFNQGNLHVLVGRQPALTLRSVIAGDASPEELILPVDRNLWLLPAESGAEVVHALTPMDRARLQVRLAGLMDQYDVTVVDAGTGIESVVRAALTRASRLVAVATPEPAALADTYALIKILSLEAPSLPVDVLVNRVFEPSEGEAAYRRLEDAAGRFLGRTLRSLGSIADQPELARAVRGSRSLLEWDAPLAPVARRLLQTEVSGGSMDPMHRMVTGGRSSS